MLFVIRMDVAPTSHHEHRNAQYNQKTQKNL